MSSERQPVVHVIINGRPIDMHSSNDEIQWNRIPSSHRGKIADALDRVMTIFETDQLADTAPVSSVADEDTQVDSGRLVFKPTPARAS